MAALETQLGQPVPNGMRGQQAMLLDGLSSAMDNTPGVFVEATRKRDQYHKQLVQKLEETIRLTATVRAHLLQKAKHVKETANSCTSKFEHEMSRAQKAMSNDLVEMAEGVAQQVEELEKRVCEAEAALEEQRRTRMAHIEATLGPIRDEALRIADALVAERKVRKLQEEEREKLLADEIEAVTILIDKEKFNREQQMKEVAKWADAQEQRVAKHQYQMDKEIREHVKSVRVGHQVMVKDRIEKQNGIVESIASFIMRYREKMGAQA